LTILTTLIAQDCKYIMNNDDLHGSHNIYKLAHIRAENSDIHIYISMCMTTRNIHIFKYNKEFCAYDVFQDQEAACDFINRPIPRI
jgi:hypothetical protein